MKKVVPFLVALTLASPALAQRAPDVGRMTANNAVERQIEHQIRRPNHVNFQNQYDSKILGERQFKTPGEAYKASLPVADCLTKRAGEEAKALVGGFKTPDPAYDGLIKALTGKKYNRCATADAWGVPMNIINGALAEEMIKAEKPSLDNRARGINPQVAQAFYTDAGGKTLESVARCLAVYSPGLVVEMLQSKVGTPQEKAALNDLFARSPECGVEASPDYFTVDEQRSSIATGLYHWLHRS